MDILDKITPNSGLFQEGKRRAASRHPESPHPWGRWQAVIVINDPWRSSTDMP